MWGTYDKPEPKRYEEEDKFEKGRKAAKDITKEAEKYKIIENKVKFENLTQLYDRCTKEYDKYRTSDLRILCEELLKRMFQYMEKRE